ncbi:hypothetical protein [Roseovarius sp.]|uniref:hypothetical protein n=1 Tax=Roseovarius sp. TaxID=1486281 RepID=UPI003BAC185C
MQQIEPATKHNAKKQKADDHPLISRTDAAREAGMSPHQHKQAMRTGNIPADQFEDMIDQKGPRKSAKSLILSQCFDIKRKTLIDISYSY